MSSSNNTIYKKTSFLAGNNSEFINEFYADYISDPNSLPESWRKFFDGLSDDEKLVYENLKGPSWSPKKRIQKLNIKLDKLETSDELSTDLNVKSIKQASKDSVRAIMLIRAYRIRGHLIANLDPLSIQKKEEHPELKPESYGFKQTDYDRKIFWVPTTLNMGKLGIIYPEGTKTNWNWKLSEVRKLTKEEQEDPQYEGHEHTLDLENSKVYGQYEFLDACKEMGIIKEL